MRSSKSKKVWSVIIGALLVISALPVSSFAADGTLSDASADTAKTAPEYCYYVQGDDYHYAETIPTEASSLFNAVDAVLFFDGEDNSKVVYPAAEANDSANKGILSQFDAGASDVEGKEFTYRSASLAYASLVVGYPKVSLSYKTASNGTITITLEQIDGKGVVTEVARATLGAVSGSDQTAEVTLKRSYDDGMGQNYDFTAFNFLQGSSVRVRITSDVSIVLHQDGKSSVTIPAIDQIETSYNGEASVDGKIYCGTLYWMQERMYLNYDNNEKWLSLPANTAYTVDSSGAADFGAFSFRQLGNRAAKEGVKQNYTEASGVYTQPIPTYRHIYVDTVDIQPVSDLLYLPTTKNLFQDIFYPTEGLDESEALHAAVIYIHGFNGSYSSLSQSFAYEMLKKGYVVVGVDLRNYPSNYAPDYYQDVKGNIRHLRANAESYGIDPDRIGIYGVSLGGNTALMMAVSAGNEYVEGSVGGNTDVSSRVQAAICGYAWTDALNFGLDQRNDCEYDPALQSRMIAGGDGETAPCAQAINFYGPGKGYLVLRNYIAAREAAEAEGRLGAFLAAPYTFTIDQEYVDKWYPGTAPPTLGTYTYTHEELNDAIAYAHAASPLYYISPDDPTIMLFGGFGGTQNITNNQSTRTLKKLAEYGVEGLMAGNTNGNYGNADEIIVTMVDFLDKTLKTKSADTKIALTVGSGNAVVNSIDTPVTDAVIVQDGKTLINLEFIKSVMKADYDKTAEGVADINGISYGTAEYVAALTGATVNEYNGETPVSNTKTEPYKTVVIAKRGAAAAAASPSAVVEPTRISLPGQYEGYYAPEMLYTKNVEKNFYVEVPAQYPKDIVEFPSEQDPTRDPSYNAANQTIKLAVTVVIPSQDGTAEADGKFPTVFEISRGGRGKKTSQYDVDYLTAHGYVWVCIEMRGCGASFGINNSFASLENRNDVKYLMENFFPDQPWCSGKYALTGGSNRGLIQWAVAATQPKGLVALAPAVNNVDFFYQDYRNGVSCVPGKDAVKSGTSQDVEVKTYEEWIESNSASRNPVIFADEDPDGKLAYQAYAYQTRNNMAFTVYLLEENLLRDEPNKNLYGEKTNETIPALGKVNEIIASGVQVKQMIGYNDSNVTLMTASTNLFKGKSVIGPWGHGATIRGTEIEKFPESLFAVTVDNVRFYDHIMKDMDNGYKDQPSFYYYVIGARKGTEWRYSDTYTPENVTFTRMYLAPASSGEIVNDALTFAGRNNGKLSLVLPKTETAAEYKVDLTTVPQGVNNGDTTNALPMQADVDSKALTFTSAPLNSATELVGVPSLDIWVSCEDSDDIDFICYLEDVSPDGTSSWISSGVCRASHRTTAPDALWDSLDGLAGNYHTSLMADVSAKLSEGLDRPTQLTFNMEGIGYCVPQGHSLRVTVTCANPTVYQHNMYYKTNEQGEYVIENNRYVYKDAADLPTIKLYQGGDHASFVNIPVMENRYNTVNGTVSFIDGSYSGPGTMYLFEKNWYLYYNGMWTKLSVEGGENSYTVKDKAAVFDAGFSFLIEGNFAANGIAQNYKGGGTNTLPFPTYINLLVDRVDNQIGNQCANELLYLPHTKSLYINLWQPEGASEAVPLIMFIHGFGGTIIPNDPYMWNLLAQGYAIAGVDLRNYPPNESPIYYQDIKGDIRFLRANASKYGLDPDKFGIYGSSLGGNTSLMMLVSGGDEAVEGTVGGNLNVSSRVQAGICGYAWSDALNFGLDQRNDHDYNFKLWSGMVSGGDGEAAPCAQAIGFNGPGKGYLVLRNYVLARAEAEANGVLEEFLSQPYTVVIDDAYIAKWFPASDPNAFISANLAPVTKGVYTYEHNELEHYAELAAKASPYSYASPDDPVFVVFGGFGGSQNITNTQSVRTEYAMQEAGVLCFYFGSTVVPTSSEYSRYGSPSMMNQTAFTAYWDHYLKKGVEGTKVVLSLGADRAVVNYVDRVIEEQLKIEDGKPSIPASVINSYFGTNLTGYLTVDEVKEAIGAAGKAGSDVSFNAAFNTVTIEMPTKVPIPVEPVDTNPGFFTPATIGIIAGCCVLIIIAAVLIGRNRKKGSSQ